MLVGLDVLGDTPAARRGSLSRASDDELADRLRRLALALRLVDPAPIAEAAALPVGEVIASPYALRAAAMGVGVGATSRHRELRASIDWTESFAPPEVCDPDHDVWSEGVLRSGKYQGFVAEAPMATFDPAHISKWGPHELMHRAVGFFWRPDLTRWELYLGARLNELVPVVLFYGPEQAMRLDEEVFDRTAAGLSPNADAADALWRCAEGAELDALAARAVPVFREGLAHFERELAAIDEERSSGRRVRVPHPFLDASSDATAYVVGHHERLRSQPVTAALASVREGWRWSTVAAYRAAVEDAFDRLLFASLPGTPDPEERRARERWDLRLRVAHMGVDPSSFVDDKTSELTVRARLEAALGEDAARLVLAAGTPASFHRDQLEAGVTQVAPCSLALMADGSVVDRFAASMELRMRGPLAQRFERWARGMPAAVRSMLRFERALVEARRDDAIERLCTPPEALPDDLRAGWLLKSTTVTHLSFEHDVIASHAAFADGFIEPPPANPSDVLVVGFRGEVAVLPLPPGVTEPFSAVAHGAPAAELIEEIDALWRPVEGWPVDGEAWVRELCAAGALGYRDGAPSGTD